MIAVSGNPWNRPPTSALGLLLALLGWPTCNEQIIQKVRAGGMQGCSPRFFEHATMNGLMPLERTCSHKDTLPLSSALYLPVPVTFRQVRVSFLPPAAYTYKVLITNVFNQSVSALILRIYGFNATSYTGLLPVEGKPGFFTMSSRWLPLAPLKTSRPILYTQAGPAASFVAHLWKLSHPPK